MKKSAPSRLPLLVLLLFLSAAGVVGYYSYRWMKHQAELNKNLPQKAEKFCRHYIVGGQLREEWRKYGEAEEYYRRALDIAPTDNLKYEAMLKLARLFLKMSETREEPYSTLAKQYFETLISLDKDSRRIMESYQGLIDVAMRQHDMDGVNQACQASRVLATNLEDRAAILLHQLEVYKEIGNWQDLSDLLVEVRDFTQTPAWRDRFELEEARVYEHLLLHTNRFNEYAQLEYPEEPADDVRAHLFKQTLGLFQDLAARGDSMTRDDALFRIARLLCTEGKFRESQYYIQTFLENEPSIHLDETLLLLARMARMDGESDTAESLISVFLKRYRMNTQAADEFMAVVNQLEEKKKYSEAFDLIGQYVNLPVSKPYLTELLARAAQMANRLGRYEEGMQYFNRLLQAGPEPQLLANALIDQANACLQRNDLAAAERWYIHYLERFPQGDYRGEAVYGLFDIKVRRKAPATEIILAGADALDANPGSARAVDTLVTIARALEKVGLPLLAQAQYNKIGLLNVAGFLGSGDQNLTQAIGDAMLGNARCLLAMGDKQKADHLLRQICNTFDPGLIRSEAAYWWAGMTIDQGQFAEARRRLALADTAKARPDIAAKIQFEQNLLDIAAGAPVATTLDKLLPRLANLPPGEYGDFVRRAYSIYFERLAELRDVASMRKLLLSALEGPYGRELPLQAFYLRMAQVVLTDQGPDAFVRLLADYPELAVLAGEELRSDKGFLTSTITAIEDLRGSANQFITGAGFGASLDEATGPEPATNGT